MADRSAAIEQQRLDSRIWEVVGYYLKKHPGSGGGSVAWDDITGKPSSFAPSTHGNSAHSSAFVTQSEIDTSITTHSGSATVHHTNANDPSASEKAALAGTTGTPGGANKYVTDTDARMTNSRTPTAHNHAATDINSGSIDGDRLAAATTVKRGGVPATGTPSGKFLRDDDTWQTVSGGGSHASTHVTGGGDTIANAIAGGNSGLMSGSDKSKLDGIASGATAYTDEAAQDAAAAMLTAGSHTAVSGTYNDAGNAYSLAVQFGSTGSTACVGNDSRLSNARTPTSHASSHVTGGGDTIADVVAGGNSGLMSGSDKTKLNGIAAGAEVNVNADWNSSSGDSQIMNKPTTMPPSSHDNTAHSTAYLAAASFVGFAKISVQASAPVGPSVNDLWVDT